VFATVLLNDFRICSLISKPEVDDSGLHKIDIILGCHITITYRSQRSQ